MEVFMFSEKCLEKFRTDLRGELIKPGEVEYDIARKVYNGIIDRHPRLSSAVRTWRMLLWPSILPVTATCSWQSGVVATTREGWGSVMTAWSSIFAHEGDQGRH